MCMGVPKYICFCSSWHQLQYRHQNEHDIHHRPHFLLCVTLPASQGLMCSLVWTIFWRIKTTNFGQIYVCISNSVRLTAGQIPLVAPREFLPFCFRRQNTQILFFEASFFSSPDAFHPHASSPQSFRVPNSWLLDLASINRDFAALSVIILKLIFLFCLLPHLCRLPFTFLLPEYCLAFYLLTGTDDMYARSACPVIYMRQNDGIRQRNRQ